MTHPPWSSAASATRSTPRFAWSRPTGRRFCSRVPATGLSRACRGPHGRRVSKPSTARHSEPAVRERNLHKFSSGKVRAVVATDVAARGIHVDNVDLVIHFDAPTTKAYLHRWAVRRAPARTVASPSPRRSSSTRSCACSAAPALRCCTTTCARLRACSPPRRSPRPSYKDPAALAAVAGRRAALVLRRGLQAIPRPGWRAASSRGRSRRHPSSVHRWPSAGPTATADRSSWCDGSEHVRRGRRPSPVRRARPTVVPPVAHAPLTVRNSCFWCGNFARSMSFTAWAVKLAPASPRASMTAIASITSPMTRSSTCQARGRARTRLASRAP